MECISRGDDEDYCVQAGELKEYFDALLITIPVPQLLAIKGNFSQLIGKFYLFTCTNFVLSDNMVFNIKNYSAVAGSEKSENHVHLCYVYFQMK